MQTLSTGALLQHGTYRIERVLGQGSFGITYLATARFTTQGSLGRMEVEAKVAVKEFFMSEVNIRRQDGSSVDGSSVSIFTNYRRKFRKEAENLSRLSHSGIVKVFDVFDENNTTYYVMEFLEGTNLDDYIRIKGHLSENEAVSIIMEVGGALSYMHSRKMLHLDIKPRNIMRKSDGRCYLIDFGLSKQFSEDGEPESSTSIGLGTPGYSPIEQSGYRQDGTFPATLDVYALGATMFKMLTGKRPPEATGILNEGFPSDELTAISVEGGIINALQKAMAPRKSQRHDSVESFLSELAAASGSIGCSPDSTAVDRADVDEIASSHIPDGDLQDDTISVSEPRPECLSEVLWCEGTPRDSYVGNGTNNDSDSLRDNRNSGIPKGREDVPPTEPKPRAASGDTSAPARGKNNKGCLIWAVAVVAVFVANIFLGEYGMLIGVAGMVVLAVISLVKSNSKSSRMYNKGLEAYQNNEYIEAVKWFRKAADKGHAEAQYNLGVMYENGEGVTRDKAEVVKWYCKAADQGDEDAISALNRLGVVR